MIFPSKLIHAGLAFLGVLTAGAFLGACGDDPVTPPPVTYAPITVFHGAPDATLIDFKAGGSTIADNVTYPNTMTAQAPTGGGTRVSVHSDAGTELGNATVQVDSTRSVWVVYSGLALANPRTDNVFGVSVPKPAVPAGKAAIRAIHASSNAPKVDVRLGDALGAKIATALEYKKAGDFTSLDTTIRTISITRAEGSGAGAELMSVTLPAVSVGKSYTVLIHGSTLADSNSAARVMVKVIPEP